MFQLKDFDFTDKKVLLRVDFDTPVDKVTGIIKDDFRIKISIPTIKYLLEANAKQIILMWKLGRPKNNESYWKTDKGAERLSKLINEKVVKVDSWDNIPDKRIVALENVRFSPDEKSNNMDQRAKQIASLGEVFVNDAFAMAHRSEATTTGIMKYLPSCIGLNFEKELNIISKVVKNPKKPFIAIIGGAKADKINVVNNLLKKVDKLIISGILANTFLKASGVNIGNSKYTKESVDDAKKILNKFPDKIILLKDAVLGKEYEKNTESKFASINEDLTNWMILDVGPETVKEYKEILSDAKTVVWGGPLGVFEFEKFRNGSFEIAKSLASKDTIKLIGGGDTGEAIRMFKLEDKMTHVSSGGGAFLELMAGKKLPTVRELHKNYVTFN